MVANWYKEHGYHFLALSDHNLLQTGERWIATSKVKNAESALALCALRFGAAWTAKRMQGNEEQIRLRTLAEFGPLLEETNRFLLIPATEITARYQIWPVHMNATNIRQPIPPPSGLSVLDVMQRCVDAVVAQRIATRQPILVHLNHPNFGWAVTAEDLMHLRGEHFFEVYNGHPAVHNQGDGTRLGTESMWDIALAFRLARTRLGPLYGLAVDDSHNYGVFSPEMSNPGRGWVMVRAARLDAASLIQSLERGDFYSSTGVELEEVVRGPKQLQVRIKPQEGVTYTIRFIGTPKGFNPDSEAIVPKDGRPYATTRKYRPEVGKVLMEVADSNATYTLKGNELYVRAVVISSRDKEASGSPGEKEMAWVQPLIPGQ